MLKQIDSLEIIPTTPFAFDSTFHKPDHFTSGDNYWEPGVRWQTWNWQGKQLGLKFVNAGSIDLPQIRVDIYYHQELPQEFVASLAEEVRYRYNLDLNLSPFYSALDKDHVLGPLFKRWRGMRPGHPDSLYEYLLIGIVLQNATVRRSMQMFQALLEKYGKLLEFFLFHHWDFFNHISPWEQKIYSKLFFDTDPEKPVPVKQLLEHFEQYGKYKQLAVHYIWEDVW